MAVSRMKLRIVWAEGNSVNVRLFIKDMFQNPILAARINNDIVETAPYILSHRRYETERWDRKQMMVQARNAPAGFPEVLENDLNPLFRENADSSANPTDT
jgi:hypothetical protein